jgi:hypothetical protein
VHGVVERINQKLGKNGAARNKGYGSLQRNEDKTM